MVSFTEQQQQQQTGVETPPDFENESCKEELGTKIATTLDHKSSLKDKKVRIKWSRRDIMTATAEVEALEKEAETLENEVQSLTTQLQEIKATCTDFIPLDCCQVHELYTFMWIVFIYSFPMQIKVVNSSVKTGLYEIKDPCSRGRKFNYAKIHVRCDMETDGGGWIVIQRRIATGTLNFYRNWEDYVNGFGDLEGEFWIGLENIHELTKQQDVELQVTLWNDDETIIWNYPTFSVASMDNYYRLTVSEGRGNGTDALAYNNGHYFSTFDYDNDGHIFTNCASVHQGGWWYYKSYRYYYLSNSGICTNANLNGRHMNQISAGSGYESSGLSEDSVARLYWSSHESTYDNSEMKIRSKTCDLGY